MKRLLIILAVAALTFTSCSSNTPATAPAVDSTLTVADSFPNKLDSCALIDTLPKAADSVKK